MTTKTNSQGNTQASSRPNPQAAIPFIFRHFSPFAAFSGFALPAARRVLVGMLALALVLGVDGMGAGVGAGGVGVGWAAGRGGVVGVDGVGAGEGGVGVGEGDGGAGGNGSGSGGGGGSRSGDLACLRRAVTDACWRAAAAGAGVTGSVGAPRAPAALRQAFEDAAAAESVPVELLMAIAEIESGFAPWSLNSGGLGRVVGSKAEAVQAAKRAGPGVSLGLMQIQRRWLGVFGVSLAEAFEPAANVRLGARVLRIGIERYGLRGGLEAYHGAPGLKCTSKYRVRVMRRALALAATAAEYIAEQGVETDFEEKIDKLPENNEKCCGNFSAAIEVESRNKR